MAGLDLKGLISKLNPVCQRALEAAAGLCLSRTNYNVEIEHWLVKLLEQPGNDLCLLLKHFELTRRGCLQTSPKRSTASRLATRGHPCCRRKSVI